MITEGPSNPSNDLTGALPAGLGDLGPALKILDLYKNAITSLPTEIGALTSLVYAYLHSNNIASVPSELGALTN